MHYKNGREAKNGDVVVAFYGNAQVYTGVLFNAKAEQGSDCNGSLAQIEGAKYADLKNCLHVDDIAAANIPDSSLPASPPV